MNIAIVTAWYPCGAGYVSKAYRDILQKHHRVYIYARGGLQCAKGNPHWDDRDVTWPPLTRSIARNWGQAMSMNHFARWLAEKNIDAVLFNEQHDIRIARETKRLGYLTGAYIDYYRKDEVNDFQQYDFLVCNTKRHYSVFQNHPHCLFIQWGTDINLFKPRAGYVKPSAAVTFFHSAGNGGVNLRKGTDLAVKGFARVTGPAQLIIHSQAPLSKYGDIANTISSDPRITFINKTVEPPGLYAMGDVYVYPSKLDGIGLSIPEALACGLPVVTTDSPPMNEFVEDGMNGFLVRVSHYRNRSDNYYWPECYADVADLTAKLQHYIDHPETLLRQQRNARLSAEERFDFSANARCFADAIGNMPRARLSYRRSRSDAIRWFVNDLTAITSMGAMRYARVILNRLRCNKCL